jgi:hypothetical protein
MKRSYNAPDILDENYKIISRTTWAPDDTSTITWRRQQNNAVGTFPSVRAAYDFIHTHLNACRAPNRPVAFLTEAITSPSQDATARLAFEEATQNALVEISGPVEVQISLATLNTASLREIIDSESENHNMIAQNDEKYRLLTTLEWSGQCTKKIQWRREGQVAIGTFGYCEDASRFVFGHLGSRWIESCFLAVETEDSKNYRGKVAEDILRTRTRADDIVMPERQPWGVDVVVPIPLKFLDIEGLKERHTIYARDHDVREVNVFDLPDKSAGPV